MPLRPNARLGGIMIDIDAPGRELVVTFTRDGEVLDEFYCTGGTTAVTMLARGLLALRPVLQPGDVLSVEWRRRSIADRAPVMKAP
jgi:hypothetical protein